MKSALMVAALMLFVAAGAGATDIAGKWGIGAAVFGGGGEVSLIRGRSARSAWLFDVLIKQQSEEIRYEPPPPFMNETIDNNAVTLLAGPGYRRFTRPNEAFSPYWDIRVRGSYARARGVTSSQQVTSTRTDSGVDGELSFGLEYFTRWHFSVAAHTGLAQLSWIRSTAEHADMNGIDQVTRDTVGSSIGLSPVLYVRAYF